MSEFRVEERGPFDHFEQTTGIVEDFFGRAGWEEKKMGVRD
jgi:hypothetical protein